MNECDEIVRKLEGIKDGEITETHVCRAVLDDAWRAMQGLEALWSGLENHFFRAREAFVRGWPEISV